MDKVLSYTLREEDLSDTAGGLVNLVLKNKVRVTGHEISAAKFTPDGITCDGAMIRVTERMRPGQTLRVRLPEEADAEKLIPAVGPVRVLYEDEDLIAVDKAAGEVVHPGPGHYTDTAANYVTWYLLSRDDAAREPGPEHAGREETAGLLSAEEGSKANKELPASGTAALRIIGRLDKETSGVLVFAKNRAAAARLQRQRREGIFVRTYLAVCEGIFPGDSGAGEQEGEVDSGEHYGRRGTIDRPLEKVPGVLMKMRTAQEGGLRAVTHYEVVREWEEETDRPPAASASPVNGSAEGEAEELRQACDRKANAALFGSAMSEAEMQQKGGGRKVSAVLSGSAVSEAETQQGACDRKGRSLLRLTIETGRTHQIRVHLASIGHPIVGDTLYGSDAAGQIPANAMPEAVSVMPEAAADALPGNMNTTPGADVPLHEKSMPEAAAPLQVKSMPDMGADGIGPRALLHAFEVRCRQPFTGEEILITSPLPEDFREYLPVPSGAAPGAR